MREHSAGAGGLSGAASSSALCSVPDVGSEAGAIFSRESGGVPARKAAAAGRDSSAVGAAGRCFLPEAGALSISSNAAAASAEDDHRQAVYERLHGRLRQEPSSGLPAHLEIFVRLGSGLHEKLLDRPQEQGQATAQSVSSNPLLVLLIWHDLACLQQSRQWPQETLHNTETPIFSSLLPVLFSCCADSLSMRAKSFD